MERELPGDEVRSSSGLSFTAVKEERRQSAHVCVTRQCHRHGRRAARDVPVTPCPEHGVQVSISPEPREKPRLLSREQVPGFMLGHDPPSQPQLTRIFQGQFGSSSEVLETPPHDYQVQSPAAFHPGCTLSFLPRDCTAPSQCLIRSLSHPRVRRGLGWGCTARGGTRTLNVQFYSLPRQQGGVIEVS